jgi:hypothetical protein
MKTELTPEIKAKISQCLAYSMNIGSDFSFNDYAGSVCASHWNTESKRYDYVYTAYISFSEGGLSLDSMITDLANHISKSNLETALTEEND